MAYRTYKKEKWTCLLLSIVTYFLPFIVVSSIFFPIITVPKGFKFALGFGVLVINTVPFLMGVCRSFFAHFPMFNIIAVVFMCLAVFFTMDIFQYYVEVFCWIEGAAAAGSILSCVFWAEFKKYSDWRQSNKANIKSGAFVMKEEKQK